MVIKKVYLMKLKKLSLDAMNVGGGTSSPSVITQWDTKTH